MAATKRSYGLVKEWLTIREAEKRTGIPERSIRRYIALHGRYLQVKKHHRSYLLAAETLHFLGKIRDYYAAGWNSEQVEEALAREGGPVTITVAEGENLPAMTVAEALMDLRRAMAEAVAAVAKEQKRMARELEELRQELAATRELLAKQEEERRLVEAERERLLEERDKWLIEEMRRLLKKKPWWKFW